VWVFFGSPAIFKIGLTHFGVFSITGNFTGSHSISDVMDFFTGYVGVC